LQALLINASFAIPNFSPDFDAKNRASGGLQGVDTAASAYVAARHAAARPICTSLTAPAALSPRDPG